jgi:hypothetical protein
MFLTTVMRAAWPFSIILHDSITLFKASAGKAEEGEGLFMLGWIELAQDCV